MMFPHVFFVGSRMLFFIPFIRRTRQISVSSCQYVSLRARGNFEALRNKKDALHCMIISRPCSFVPPILACNRPSPTTTTTSYRHHHHHHHHHHPSSIIHHPSSIIHHPSLCVCLNIFQHPTSHLSEKIPGGCKKQMILTMIYFNPHTTGCLKFHPLHTLNNIPQKNEKIIISRWPFFSLTPGGCKNAKKILTMILTSSQHLPTSNIHPSETEKTPQGGCKNTNEWPYEVGRGRWKFRILDRSAPRCFFVGSKVQKTLLGGSSAFLGFF